MNIYLQAILVVGILSLFKKVRKRWYVSSCATGSYTAIPNREVQGFYREIRVQGNSNYMLCQCTGFEGSNFDEIQGNICILYRN